jgi:hypothetical protein
MKWFGFIKFIFLGFAIAHLSCSNCQRIRCAGNGGYVNVRLMRDGKNAVFGPDAFIDHVSLQLYTPIEYNDYPDLTYSIQFVDSTQSIILYLTSGPPQILTFPGSSDTLTSTSVITHMGECCSTYKLSSLYWNEREICIDECGNVMEIEI